MAFLNALQTIQTRYPASGLSEDELWEIVRDEERRVADAILVAEILLPQIQSLLKQHRPASAPAATAAVEPPPPARSEPRPPSRPAAPLGVADLIEGMLDQQRSERRPHRS
jgi:hypothetical protein